jgi:hypothetical protein
MTNQDRNARTLITCFVIALFALVPLRIIESQSYIPQDTMVLGDETYYEEPIAEEDYYMEEEIIEESEMVLGEEDQIVEDEVVEEVELPNAEILE